MKIPFIKCQGSGNDFVLVDVQHLDGRFSSEELSEFARAVCLRSGPIGADGLLIVAHPAGFDGEMIMLNVDGTLAKMCGNGLRCVARFLLEQSDSMVQNQLKKIVNIKTGLGTVRCEREATIAPGVITISAWVGPVNLNAAEIPIVIGLPTVINQPILELDPHAYFTALSIPNPHLIALVDTIDLSRLTRWGETVTRYPELFPEGMNVSMVRVDGPQNLYVQTYERGCGLTAACGTAIASSSYVSCLLGVCSKEIPIHIVTQGGMTRCLVSDKMEGRVQLTGNATFMNQGMLNWNSESALGSIEDKKIFFHEIEAYQAFIQS